MCIYYVCAKSLQLYLTLCDPMDHSPGGSSVHGILQARILEWVVITFSRGSSQPRDQTCVSYVSCTDRQVLDHQPHLGSPRTIFRINLFSAALGLCGCTWALWQVGATLQLQWVVGLSLQGFSCWGHGLQAYGLQTLRNMGLVALRHVRFSWTKDRTRVPRIGKWILNCWTTRDIQCGPFLKSF